MSVIFGKLVIIIYDLISRNRHRADDLIIFSLPEITPRHNHHVIIRSLKGPTPTPHLKQTRHRCYRHYYYYYLRRLHILLEMSIKVLPSIHIRKPSSMERDCTSGPPSSVLFAQRTSTSPVAPAKRQIVVVLGGSFSGSPLQRMLLMSRRTLCSYAGENFASFNIAFTNRAIFTYDSSICSPSLFRLSITRT